MYVYAYHHTYVYVAVRINVTGPENTGTYVLSAHKIDLILRLSNVAG